MSTPRSASIHTVARGLGWFSIGLGLAELLAPRAMARATGLRGHEGTLQAYGLREIAAGVGLLLADDPAPWLWARVGGDAMDFATLAVQGRPSRPATAAAIAAVVGVTALDIAAARAAQARTRPRRPMRDYSDRSGLPLPAGEMRGMAREDFEPPADMATPALLRPRAVS